MYYLNEIENSFRFGDVIKGFIHISPVIRAPLKEFTEIDYTINVNHYKYYVILSPCCSISDKIISLSPLIQIRGSFFDNPYFEENLTNINRKMAPKQAVPEKIWNNLSQEEQIKRNADGMAYAFQELFIYESNVLFKEYEINRKGGNIKTNFYMIDFRNTYKVDCEKIINPVNVPIESKCLQLTVETREELRSKISFYYGRTPNKDRVLLES